MGKKAFLIDVARCNGCRNCQIACKDEHCGTDWVPYAAAQPETGQFWCDVEETVHGSVPKVNVTYLPRFGAQNEKLAAFAPECVNVHESGLVWIDPAKAKGRKDVAEHFVGVYWNEELNLPQGCTGCVHLLDDGWDEPRCVDACATGALRFVDEEEARAQGAEQLEEGSKAYYLNVPKRWVAGEVYDPEADEVLIGAKVTLASADGSEAVAVTETDEFGDFWFKQVEPAAYTVWFEADGYLTRQLPANAVDTDAHVGSIALYAAE